MASVSVSGLQADAQLYNRVVSAYRSGNKNELIRFVLEQYNWAMRLTRTSDGNQQTVAAHSWNMAMMAMVLRPCLKKSVNMERVYELCVLHDLPEAITHDIPLHEQTDSVRVQKRINESDAVAQIVGLLKNNDIQARFNEYDDRQSYESRLVKALDVLDTAVQHMCAQDLAYIGEYVDDGDGVATVLEKICQYGTGL